VKQKTAKYDEDVISEKAITQGYGMGEKTEPRQGGTGQQKAQDTFVLTMKIFTATLFHVMRVTGKVNLSLCLIN
jgi:hypothetical protein